MKTSLLAQKAAALRSAAQKLIEAADALEFAAGDGKGEGFVHLKTCSPAWRSVRMDNSSPDRFEYSTMKGAMIAILMESGKPMLMREIIDRYRAGGGRASDGSMRSQVAKTDEIASADPYRKGVGVGLTAEAVRKLGLEL